MTPPAEALLLEQTEERLRRDPSFSRVLAQVLEMPVPEHQDRHSTARALNAARRAGVREAFMAGALDTKQVQHLLGLGTPQAVHGRRSRGTLLGERIGDVTWFPSWQFDPASGRTRPHLRRILALLRAFTTDAIVADRVMRQHHDDLGGTVDEALAAGGSRAAAAWNVLVDLGS